MASDGFSSTMASEAVVRGTLDVGGYLAEAEAEFGGRQPRLSAYEAQRAADLAAEALPEVPPAHSSMPASPPLRPS